MTTESWQNIPHVSYQYEPDVTKFVEEFKKFTAEHQGDSGAKITFNAVLLKAIALLAILIPACVSSSPAFLMMYSSYKLSKQGDNIQP